MVTKEQVIKVLEECYDPELNIDVYNLGLIYGINIEENIVNIKMTLTSMFCPYGNELINEIKAKIKINLKEIKNVNIEVVFDPPWQLPEELRAIMQDLNI